MVHGVVQPTICRPTLEPASVLSQQASCGLQTRTAGEATPRDGNRPHFAPNRGGGWALWAGRVHNAW